MYRTRWREIAMCASCKGSHSTHKDLIIFLIEKPTQFLETLAHSWLDCLFYKSNETCVNAKRLRCCQKRLAYQTKEIKPVSLGYPLSVFNKNSTLKRMQKRLTYHTKKTTLYAKETYKSDERDSDVCKQTYPPVKRDSDVCYRDLHVLIRQKRLKCIQKRPNYQIKETQMNAKETYWADKRDFLIRQKWPRCMQQKPTEFQERPTH